MIHVFTNTENMAFDFTKYLEILRKLCRDVQMNAGQVIALPLTSCHFGSQINVSYFEHMSQHLEVFSNTYHGNPKKADGKMRFHAISILI